MGARVLVVDDERDVGRLLTYSLDQAGFETVAVTTGAEALLAAARQPPAVIVLDVGLPDLSGIEVCKKMRADRELADVGVIMLTALGAREDRIVGFEAGADDYVVKPFDVEEVVLRVRALVRRISERKTARGAKSVGTAPLSSGTLTVDITIHEVRGDGELLSLRPLEFKLLTTLLGEPGRVFSREELLRQVWEIEHGSVRTVDVHVRRLRLNLGAWADQIETVPGFGYRAKKELTSTCLGIVIWAVFCRPTICAMRLLYFACALIPMRRIAASLILVALAASTAAADDRTWEGVFVGSVSVALVGGALWWHGNVQIDHAEENLCTGAYADSCDHAPPMLPSQIAHYNDNGETGDTLAKVGGVMILGGAILGGVAAYKAFIAGKPAEKPRMTLAPTVSSQSAGAAFSLRW